MIQTDTNRNDKRKNNKINEIKWKVNRSNRYRPSGLGRCWRGLYKYGLVLARPTLWFRPNFNVFFMISKATISILKSNQIIKVSNIATDSKFMTKNRLMETRLKEKKIYRIYSNEGITELVYHKNGGEFFQSRDWFPPVRPAFQMFGKINDACSCQFWALQRPCYGKWFLPLFFSS